MRTLCLVGLLAIAASSTAAEEARLPIVEEEVVREVEALLDRTPAPSERQIAEAKKLVDAGTRSHDAQRYEQAIELYKKAIEIDPIYSIAYYEMAFTLSESGDQARALDQVVRALTLNPRNEHAYVLKGNVLDNLGFPAEAKKTYLDLLAVNSASYLGHLNLGVCELRLDNAESAEAELKKARDLEPDRPSPYFFLAKSARSRDFNYDEHDYLEKFLALGKDDPRAETARARLAELNRHDVAIDPNAPYMTIALSEKLSRVAWQTTRHKQLHPEAHAYALTYEEEKDVLSEVVIPGWRKVKADNPAASEPRYDLLLKIDGAGFLDEYIYETKRSLLGKPADDWLAAHADRKAAFEDWARKEGLLANKDESAPEPDRSLPEEVLSSMNGSKVHYVVDTGTATDSDRFLATERARFRSALTLRGPDQADCGNAARVAADTRSGKSLSSLVPIFRCFVPGEPEFEKGLSRISVLGLQVRDLAPVIDGGTVTDNDNVQVKVVSPAWLGYVMAKAAWRNEPELRKRHGGGDSNAPAIEEEIFALSAAVQAYRNGRDQPDENGDTVDAVAILDQLTEIERNGNLRGFVLYEMVHRRYGISLKSLAAGDAQAVERYLLSAVLVRAGG